jgi:hypothetical protein
MSLADALLNLEKTSSDSSPCVIARTIQAHPDYTKAVQDAMDALLWPAEGNRRLDTVELVEQLHSLGLYTSETSMTRHRKKTCTCFRGKTNK